MALGGGMIKKNLCLIEAFNVFKINIKTALMIRMILGGIALRVVKTVKGPVMEIFGWSVQSSNISLCRTTELNSQQFRGRLIM